MRDLNHKTVFVLDHTPYFGIPCGVPLDLDLKNKCKCQPDVCNPEWDPTKSPLSLLILIIHLYNLLIISSPLHHSLPHPN